MDTLKRIKDIGEIAEDAEYTEQRSVDIYDKRLEQKRVLDRIEEIESENKHDIDYLMAEVAASRAMILELATIVDEMKTLTDDG